jgi:hypothetical protein
MRATSKINEFIARAKESGASEQSIVGILTARGWPEKEVYEALAAYYERSTGLEIPARGSAATAAKDAFFYLLAFSTLATWTIGLGCLAFTLIDRWLADTLFTSGYNPTYDTYTVAAALASILVAFPIYLLVSRSILRDAAKHPEKLDSPVRKWLTYMALVIAASVFMGDLIAALTYFLRGEVTSRFLAKAFVVLILSGGVFFYYFAGLKKVEAPGEDVRLRRDSWMAALSGAIVMVWVILGFWYLGAPKTQRTLRADARRVLDLYQLSNQIHAYWGSNDHKLPERLDQLAGIAWVDPISRTPYDYRVKEGSRYELCANFSLESPQSESNRRPSYWSHPAGQHCFQLNASETPEYQYNYYPD